MLPELRTLWKTRVRKPLKRAVSRMNPAWRREEGFSQRRYDSYETYRQHQAAKFALLDINQPDDKFRKAVGDRLAKLPWIEPGVSVLCLAARTGAECKAFLERGCFAVGIDLNPGSENHYVMHGDFHHLQFADSSIDCVFTNSLDHAFDLDRIVQEVRRVLKPQGHFVAEIVAGGAEAKGCEPGRFEALWWDTTDRVAEQIVNNGFRIERREKFDAPWPGEHYAFRSLKRN